MNGVKEAFRRIFPFDIWVLLSDIEKMPGEKLRDGKIKILKKQFQNGTDLNTPLKLRDEMRNVAFIIDNFQINSDEAYEQVIGFILDLASDQIFLSRPPAEKRKLGVDYFKKR